MIIYEILSYNDGIKYIISDINDITDILTSNCTITTEQSVNNINFTTTSTISNNEVFVKSITTDTQTNTSRTVERQAGRFDVDANSITYSSNTRSGMIEYQLGSMDDVNNIISNNRIQFLSDDNVMSTYTSCRVENTEEGQVWTPISDLHEEEPNSEFMYSIFNPVNGSHTTANNLNEAVTIQTNIKNDNLSLYHVDEYQTYDSILPIFRLLIGSAFEQPKANGTTSF